MLLPHKRWRFSFSLAALFAAVMVVAFLSGAARMPLLLGVLFASDGLVLAVGVQCIRSGVDAYRRYATPVYEQRVARAQIWIGKLLAAFAAATLGIAAIYDQ